MIKLVYIDILNVLKVICWMAEILIRHVYSVFAVAFIAYSGHSVVL